MATRNLTGRMIDIQDIQFRSMAIRIFTCKHHDVPIYRYVYHGCPIGSVESCIIIVVVDNSRKEKKKRVGNNENDPKEK